MTPGRTVSKPWRFAIVAARFNAEVTDRLVESCERTLRENGVTEIVTARVPGSFEIPWAAQEFARSGLFHAIICLGAILKGKTAQNEHLAASVHHHLQALALSSRVPVVTGVLTPDTLEAALARTRGELDRGREAALAALEMAELRSEAPWKGAERRRSKRPFRE